MKFVIRRINVSKAVDRDTIGALHSACFSHDELPNLTSGFWWLAYCNGKPAGFCGLERCDQWYNAGYLCRAGVAPKYRGHGLQKRLIQVRIAQARRLDWDWLISDTTDNPASANSLISKGFRLYIPSKPWGYKNTLYWRLEIS